MDLINNFSLDISTVLMPWIALLISVVITMWIKDWIQGFVKGMQFRLNKAFNESDHVILDGDPAHIVKIGCTETVFGVYSERGYTWRYVPNSRIPYLKLERIIDSNLHLDTEAEKVRKWTEMVEKGRRDMVEAVNKER